MHTSMLKGTSVTSIVVEKIHTHREDLDQDY